MACKDKLHQSLKLIAYRQFCRFLRDNKDSKAQVIPTYNTVLDIQLLGIIVSYDGSFPPSGTFDSFDGAEPIHDTWGPTTLPQLQIDSMSNGTLGIRGTFHTISVQRYSQDLIDFCHEEGKRFSSDAVHSGVFSSIVPENLINGYGERSDPHVNAWSYSKSPQPMSFFFGWLDPLDDQYYHKRIKEVAARAQNLAKADGQMIDDLPLYPNYAHFDTPAAKLFDADNLARLRRIKRDIDPNDTMRLTKWFNI